MRWPWRRQARKVEPRRAVSIRAQELEKAKEILTEVFHTRPGEVEEMIQKRVLIKIEISVLWLKKVGRIYQVVRT